MPPKKQSRRQFCELTAGTLATVFATSCSKDATGGNDNSGSSTGDTNASTSDTSSIGGSQGSGSTQASSSSIASSGEESSGVEDSTSSSANTSDETSESTQSSQETGESSDSSETTQDSSTETTSTSTDDTGIEDDICEPAIAQLEGPYPQDCPERSDFATFGHEGRPFHFSGKVFDASCNPVVDAVVLIWHSCPSESGADAIPASQNSIDPNYISAIYDVDTGDMRGKKTPDGRTVPTGDKMYYGWVKTDSDGRYVFKTNRPGYYWDNLAPVNRYRCSHIHAKVFINDQQVLITQVYFPDDPFNAQDPLYADCKGKGDCMLRLSSDGSQGTFNFTVDA